MKNLNILTPQVLKALAFIEADKINLLSLLKKIADIPSPTFFEKEKILFLKNYLSKLGYQTKIDNAGNLVGKLDGLKKTGGKILVVAHTDTVLKPVSKITEDNKHFFGHGVCDNATGVISLLTILSLIKKFKLAFPGQLLYAFTVGEEGLGAKAGMKFILSQLKNINAVVNLESHNIGRIINQSPGQYRLELVIEAKPGGHSFRDFGNPNAIVIISKFITELAKLPGFKKGETTFNIGKIEGGEGINAIAKKGRFLLEIRSLKKDKLTFLKQNLEKLCQQFFNPDKGIRFTKKVNADTQAASLPKNHRIYKLTKEVHNYLGITSYFEMGNNDGEVALAKGIQTVTIGSSLGYKTHSLDESVEKNSLVLGVKQNLLLVLNALHNV